MTDIQKKSGQGTGAAASGLLPARRLSTRTDGVSALAASVTARGLKFPVLVVPGGRVLSGERRRVACAQAGCPVTIREVTTVTEAIIAIDAEQADGELAEPLTIVEAIWRDSALRELPPGASISDRRGRMARIASMNSTYYSRAREIVLAAAGMPLNAARSGAGVQEAALAVLPCLHSADRSVVHRAFRLYSRDVCPQAGQYGQLLTSREHEVLRALAARAGIRAARPNMPRGWTDPADLRIRGLLESSSSDAGARHTLGSLVRKGLAEAVVKSQRSGKFVRISPAGRAYLEGNGNGERTAGKS